jgi:hypothetical protein
MFYAVEISMFETIKILPTTAFEILVELGKVLTTNSLRMTQ